MCVIVIGRRQRRPAIRPTEWRSAGAERKGFDRGVFRNSKPEEDFSRNPCSVSDFRPSGRAPSVPVIPRPEGESPGQNRDKFGAPSLWLIAGIGGVLVLLGAVGGVSATERADPPAGDAEWAAKAAHTQAEVGRLVAEAHKRLPRDQAEHIGAIYARYSTRHQDSVADQVRTLLADAVQKRVFVPLEHVYYDMGVRGVKDSRDGLDALRRCLRAKAARVVFFFSTNRLFRKTHRALQFVEEEIVEQGARAVFVKSGVDTANGKRWRALYGMHAAMDEFAVGMYADHIRAAQEGLLEKGQVFGTVPFGYRGEPVPGELTRRGRPRKRLVVDPAEAEWVRRMFDWYVSDRLTITAIARRLDADPTVPPPPRSPDRRWTRLAVRWILQNTRYRGLWRYGVNENVWVSSKDYSRQVARDQPLKEVQVEELRVVSDDVWFAAQARLAKDREAVAGRKPADGDTASRPRVLNGLLWCRAHGRPLHVGGVYGKYMLCRECQKVRAADRPLFSQLPRQPAVRKTCEAVAELIRRDPDLVGRVIDTCRRWAAERQVADPAQSDAVTARRDKLDRRIGFVLRNPGESEADRRESEHALRDLRRERAEAQAELDQLRAAAGRPVRIPSPEEAADLVGRSVEVLVAFAADPDPARAGAVRRLIDLVTGGRIEVTQEGERAVFRGWLRGRFLNQLPQAFAAELAGTGEAVATAGEEVVIDYRPYPTRYPSAVTERVVALYQEGVLLKRVAAETGLPRSAVARIVRNWHLEQGLDRPDGRHRRSTLSEMHLQEPLFRRLAGPVKERADRGLLMQEIAAELGVDRTTVTSAWRFWHTSRGLEAPDGRTRRSRIGRGGRGLPPPLPPPAASGGDG